MTAVSMEADRTQVGKEDKGGKSGHPCDMTSLRHDIHAAYPIHLGVSLVHETSESSRYYLRLYLRAY